MRKHGFTLVELLVVIAVIAILAAMLFPVFSRAREKTRQSSCLSNMKQFGGAFGMYETDYDGRTPPNWYYDGPGSFALGVCLWMDMILPYLRNKQVFVCPTNRLNTAVRGMEPALTDYCLFAWGSHREEGNGTASAPYYRDVGRLPDAEVLVPAESVLLWEGATWDDNAAFAMAICNGVHRHNAGINLVFLDGHAKWVKWIDDLGVIANELIIRRNGVYVYRYLSPSH